MNRLLFVLAAIIVSALGLHAASAQDTGMSFFITGVGPGNGADLGGLEGADAYCLRLADDVGAGNRIWAAYLSATPAAGSPAINARDRIGAGPWYNAKGVMVARNVADLHGDNNNLNKETALNERGGVVNGRGDSPNRHDIMTGSQLDGTAFSSDADTTCENWTSSSQGSAMVGHHDRTGGGANPTSWNSAHGSRGCSQAGLRSTGGDALFYCFVVSG